MKNNIITIFATIVFTFVVLFIYTKLAGPIPFSVNSIQTTKSDLFRVEGVGKATAVPDTALLSLGVTKSAPNVTTAQQQVNDVANKLITDLKALGIDEKNIKTTNYSVNPNYDFREGTQTPNGYTVSQNIEVRVKPIDKANQAVDIATKDGANMVGGISFVLDDEAQKKVQEEARKEAITNAKEKAQSLAAAAGISLGRIVDIQENSNRQTPVFYGAGAALDAKTAEAPTNLTPGENTVEVTISLAYEIY